jgi:hypothetical protein
VSAKYSVVPSPQFQVEVGTDYSTTEQPVMVMDPVTHDIRQKLWIDGSPVFRRVFTGAYNPPTANNTAKGTSFSPGKVNVIHSEGYVYKSGANPNTFQVKIGDFIPYSEMRTGAANLLNISISAEIYYDASGNCSFVMESSAAVYAQMSTLDTYRVVLEYTKN